MKYALLFGLLLSAAPPPCYTVVPEGSRVGFTIRNAGLKVEGTFETFTADICFAPRDLPHGSVRVAVAVASIETGIGLRDRHLRGENYFDADRYPQLRFASERLEQQGDGFVAVGQLTLRDVTRSVRVPFTFRPTAGGATFRATFTLNRRDYGVGGGSLLMADEVAIDVTLPARGQRD